MVLKNVSGKWENDIGSSVSLVVQGNEVSGTYHTAVGDPSAFTQPAELKGILQYPLISFSVDFHQPDSPSLASWVGRFEEHNGTMKLYTLWLLGCQHAGPEHNRVSLRLWEMFKINSDIFERKN